METLCNKYGVSLFKPELKYCGDNAAMVGSQGYYEFLSGNIADLKLNAIATMDIDMKMSK
jgi:N6-L-threonylcarbamoyladenine synthase